MNDDIEHPPAPRHRATETGCDHWAPIVLPASDATGGAEAGVAPPALTEAPTVVSGTAKD